MTPAAALDGVLRADRGRLLAALAARTGDLQRAEDAVQEAAAAALVHWGRSGVPQNPVAWLVRAAFRKAIDSFRRDGTAAAHAAAMAALCRDEAAEEPEMIPDERLRLIFTCCHPALAEKSRVALTLRSVAGLSTAEIAAAFLDDEATMGQRLSRAKARIAAAGIPFAVPGPELWDERLGAVLTVVYLIYTTAYTQPGAASRGLAGEALFLARLLDRLRPGEAEVEGALALILLTEARARARAPQGETVPPAAQDRSLWDRAMIAEGQALLSRAVARRRPGPFQIKAAIAALHAGETPVDWGEVAALYGALWRHEPTPVVALNAAVARAEAGHPAEGLALIESLAPALSGFQPYHAARADVLARLGRRNEAVEVYGRAIALAGPEDARFLTARRARLMD
jgi:RNA polymerase sigma factor (sigma-70 family)